MLIANQDIFDLKQKGFNGVTEQELKNILGRYSLGQALFAFGMVSKMLFDVSGSENKTGYEILGPGAIRNPTTGVITSDFALAYLANIFLISGANDWKAKNLLQQDRAHLEILADIYNTCLLSHKIAEGERTEEERAENAKSILIRLYQEQISMEVSFMDVIARNFILFCKIAKEHPSFKYLHEAFEKANGLTIDNYFYIGLAIFALATVKMPVFTIGQLTQADDAHLGKLTKENVDAFMKMRSVDYKGFREVDIKKNEDLSEWYTKTRFNPLNLYPIIQMQRYVDGKEYVIPNVTLYVKSTFDLFWYFDNYFSSISPEAQNQFRKDFGGIFEEYVGQILKHIFGEANVHGEIKYRVGGSEVKFLDYYVEVDGKIYIFEVKANRFRLPTLQVGMESKLIDDEIKKFTKPILQIKNRFSEIDHHPELAIFKGKELIPVVVFADIPFVNDPNFYEKILSKTEQGKEVIQAIIDLKINCLNVMDLEKYADHSDSVSLENVFKQVDDSKKTSSVMSVSAKYPKNKRVGFLSKEFEAFHNEAMEVAKEEAARTSP